MNMRDRSSDVILNASICNNKSRGGGIQRLDSHFIKLLNLGFKAVFIVFAEHVK